MDVEWEELIAAFLSTRPDQEYYLDRDSGDLITVLESDRASGENDQDDDEESDWEDGGGAENIREEIESDPDRFVELRPVPVPDRVEWMSAFIRTVKEKDLAGKLVQAARGTLPEREFDRVLRKHPTERARWIGYCETQVQEVIDGWIEENDIEPDTPAPWKAKNARRRSNKQ